MAHLNKTFRKIAKHRNAYIIIQLDTVIIDKRECSGSEVCPFLKEINSKDRDPLRSLV